MALLMGGEPFDRDAPSLFPGRTGGAEIPLLPGDEDSSALPLKILPQRFGYQLELVALNLRWGKVEGAAEEAVAQGFMFEEDCLVRRLVGAGESMRGGDDDVEWFIQHNWPSFVNLGRDARHHAMGLLVLCV